MTDNYAAIVKDNLTKAFDARPLNELAGCLPAETDGDALEFRAFGRICRIRPEGIALDGTAETGVLGVLISLYALHAGPDACILEPFKAFREFPDSMPYAGAFTTHTEQGLIPHVEAIQQRTDIILDRFQGEAGQTGGDFSFVLRPLPKIALCYIFYLPDDEFPASVTCLYSTNARQFMPLDALADVGEYASRGMMELISA